MYEERTPYWYHNEIKAKNNISPDITIDEATIRRRLARDSYTMMDVVVIIHHELTMEPTVVSSIIQMVRIR